jgi:hypothetical protein
METDFLGSMLFIDLLDLLVNPEPIRDELRKRMLLNDCETASEFLDGQLARGKAD